MSGRYAIILAGGRSVRMGRDKARLTIAGRTLLARAVAACQGRDLVVVVAAELPPDVEPGAVLTALEDPPFGGPLAGLVAGAAVLPPLQADDEVMVVACDLPGVAAAVQRLDAAPLGRDGTCLVDLGGYPQYLAARYRRTALIAALPPSGEARDRSVRGVFGRLRLDQVPAGAMADDVDTPADAAAAGIDGQGGPNLPETTQFSP